MHPHDAYMTTPMFGARGGGRSSGGRSSGGRSAGGRSSSRRQPPQQSQQSQQQSSQGFAPYPQVYGPEEEEGEALDIDALAAEIADQASLFSGIGSRVAATYGAAPGGCTCCKHCKGETFGAWANDPRFPDHPVYEEDTTDPSTFGDNVKTGAGLALGVFTVFAVGGLVLRGMSK